MKKVLLLGILTYVLLLFGLLALNGEVIALVLPLLVYLAAGILWRPAQPRIRATRQLDADRVVPGRPVTVHVSVCNEGPAGEEALIEDLVPQRLTIRKGAPGILAPLPAGATLELEYTVEGERGGYPFETVRVTLVDALDLFHATTAVAVDSSLAVIPEVVRLRQLAVRPQRTLAYYGLFPARRGGPGVEFYGIREYQPGDSLRWADWHAAARHVETLFTKEFEQECIAEIGLILDVRERVYASADAKALFEHAVLASAALADSLLSGGNRVGLLLYGSLINWAIPGYGKVQRERILRALAAAVPGGFVDRLEYLPTRLFSARSQIVLVSPLVREDVRMLAQLQAHGYQLLVVSPDPISLERPDGDARGDAAARIARMERDLLLGRLRAAGIQVLDWALNKPLDHAVHTHLGRRATVWRGGRR